MIHHLNYSSTSPVCLRMWLINLRFFGNEAVQPFIVHLKRFPGSGDSESDDSILLKHTFMEVFMLYSVNHILQF
jgi:hypothetical protein